MPHWVDVVGAYLGEHDVAPAPDAAEVGTAPQLSDSLWNGTSWTPSAVAVDAALYRLDSNYAAILDTIASPHAGLNTLFSGQLVEAVLVTVRQAFDAAGIAAPSIPPAVPEQHQLLASLIGRGVAVPAYGIPAATDLATAAAHVLATKAVWATQAGQINAVRLDRKVAAQAVVSDADLMAAAP